MGKISIDQHDVFVIVVAFTVHPIGLDGTAAGATPSTESFMLATAVVSCVRADFCWHVYRSNLIRGILEH